VKDMTFFSIIVPVYKVEQYLGNCVESILSQTWHDYELILVDDGSPDKCGEICEEYAKKDDRVKVVHKKNGGLSSARNAGLDVCAGTYIIFIDSDDFWDDNSALENIHANLTETDADLLIFPAKRYYEKEDKYTYILNAEANRERIIDSNTNNAVKSKYVKSDPAGVYKEIKTLLCQGSKVLFVGLPCHAAAARKYVGEKYAENLFVADLICHGSPSQKLLKLFLEQHNKSFDSIQNIEFRKNNKYCLSLNDKYICHKDCLDKYSMGFLNALFFTENCYECKYASKKRISDITLGDSWGSSMSAEEQKRGISLILVQTEKGLQLLKDSNVELFDVDVENAVSNNHQLRHPSAKTEKREFFFAGLKKKKKFDSLVRKCYPKSSFKQWIKGILIKLHIKRNVLSKKHKITIPAHKT